MKSLLYLNYDMFFCGLKTYEALIQQACAHQQTDVALNLSMFFVFVVID
jgi:hypothetical protein